MNKEMSGNAGEWSEPYVLFKLLAEEKLFAADESLNRIPSVFFPILKIERFEHGDDESLNKIDFSVKRNNIIEVYLNDKKIKTMSSSEFNDEAQYLLSEIKNKRKGNLSIERTKNFLNGIYCYSIKADSNDKTDISIQIHDINTGFNPFCGFSIKSQLGHPSSLFNAGKSTNFVYEVRNISEKDIEIINNIKSKNKIQDRINHIKSEKRWRIPCI